MTTSAMGRMLGLLERHSVAIAAVFVLGTVAVVLWTLAGPWPARPVSGSALSLDDSWTVGSTDARVVVVEFSDFKCKFCVRFAREIQPELFRRYVQTGKVLWVFRHALSGDSVSRQAAIVSECAGEQGKFWEMHSALFSESTGALASTVRTVTEGGGFDAIKFQECSTSNRVQLKLIKEAERAADLGIIGTPTFVFGTSSKEGGLKVERIMPGIMSIAVFSEVLTLMLGREPQ